jgi:hypothetical protein
VPNFPRLRALALFGRRPAQPAERLVVAAPKNQHKIGLGRLDVALDLAATNQWTVVDMKREWKVDISLPKTVSGGSVTQFDKHWHPKNEGI